MTVLVWNPWAKIKSSSENKLNITALVFVLGSSYMNMWLQRKTPNNSFQWETNNIKWMNHLVVKVHMWTQRSSLRVPARRCFSRDQLVGELMEPNWYIHACSANSLCLSLHCFCEVGVWVTGIASSCREVRRSNSTSLITLKDCLLIYYLHIPHPVWNLVLLLWI